MSSTDEYTDLSSELEDELNEDELKNKSEDKPNDESKDDIYTTMENMRKDNKLSLKKITSFIDNNIHIETITKYFFAHDDANSLNIQGYMYEYGKGVEQDYVKACQSYEKAVNLNNALGMFNLGFMCKYGSGTQKDLKKTIELYEKAIELNDNHAMNSLALMYYHGEGVEQNHAKAIELYKKAIKLNDGIAMYNLARLYRNGEHVEQDYDKASLLFYKSAELGNDDAEDVLEENPTFVNLAKAQLKIEELEQKIATLNVLKSDGTNNVIVVGAMQYV
jgi:TPR repeat protein